MSLAVAFPIRLDVPLSRIDPRWKLAAIAAALALVSVLQTPGATAIALVCAWAIALLARLPLRWYALRLASLLAVLSVFLVFLPFLDHGDEERWPLMLTSVSPRGMRLAAALLLKAATLTTLVLCAATTAPPNVQLKALHALGVPGLIVQITALTFRYLAVVLREFAQLRIALRLRGYRQRWTPSSLRTVGHVAGILLVRAWDQSERVAQALRCRGFDGQFHALTEFRTRLTDVIFFAAVLAGGMALVLWDSFQR